MLELVRQTLSLGKEAAVSMSFISSCLEVRYKSSGQMRECVRTYFQIVTHLRGPLVAVITAAAAK